MGYVYCKVGMVKWFYKYFGMVLEINLNECSVLNWSG